MRLCRQIWFYDFWKTAFVLLGGFIGIVSHVPAGSFQVKGALRNELLEFACATLAFGQAVYLKNFAALLLIYRIWCIHIRKSASNQTSNSQYHPVSTQG